MSLSVPQPLREPARTPRAGFSVPASAAIWLLTLLLASCSSGKKPPQAPPGSAVRVVETQHGIASIYTDRRTASGERFSASAYAAAHRTWPLRCLVRCTNLGTGRWVVVRINDRGPYIRGRVIDLTPAAAQAIGLTKKQGLCRVKLERLETTPKP
jgi:rare lipoprotein A